MEKNVQNLLKNYIIATKTTSQMKKLKRYIHQNLGLLLTATLQTHKWIALVNIFTELHEIPTVRTPPHQTKHRNRNNQRPMNLDSATLYTFYHHAKRLAACQDFGIPIMQQVNTNCKQSVSAVIKLSAVVNAFCDLLPLLVCCLLIYIQFLQSQ